MNPRVTIHSDAGGVTRTITLSKTGADSGHITMASTAAPGNDQNYDVKNVQADPATAQRDVDRHQDMLHRRVASDQRRANTHS
jgi:hypothetical protein